MNLFKSLRHRPFGLTWLGQTVSRLGDSLFAIALSWWVLEKTGSPEAMGAVQIFGLAPRLVFLLIGGVLADRLPRLRVMLMSDVLRGVLVVGVAALALTQRLEVWQIYAASLVFGLVDAFFQPAYSAVLPDITPAELLPSANALTALSGQFSGIFGPAIGAGIVAVGASLTGSQTGGTGVAFGLDGISFFIAAVCVLPIMGLIAAQKRKTDAPPANALRELREGLSAVMASPWLWITIGVSALANVFFAGPIAVALPFLVKNNLNSDVGALGVIYSAFSIGSIAGAVFIGQARKLRRRGLIAYLCWGTSGLLFAGMGLTSSIAAAAILSLLAGVGLSAGQLIWTNVLQELVPGELLGRVSSVDQFGSTILLPIGYGLFGWLTLRIGAPLVFLIGGITATVLLALGLLHPDVRNLE